MKQVACVAGVRRGGEGERRAHEAREQTREDRGRGRLQGRYPSDPALILTFLTPFLRPATQAKQPAALVRSSGRYLAINLASRSKCRRKPTTCVLE